MKTYSKFTHTWISMHSGNFPGKNCTLNLQYVFILFESLVFFSHTFSYFSCRTLLRSFTMVDLDAFIGSSQLVDGWVDRYDSDAQWYIANHCLKFGAQSDLFSWKNTRCMVYLCLHRRCFYCMTTYTREGSRFSVFIALGTKR